MRETTKKTLKKIGKVIAVYYLLEVIALAIWTIVNTIMCGAEATKKIYVSVLGHVKDFYKHIFHFRWRSALGEYVDAELDGMDINVRAKYGDDVANTMMSPVYDELEKRCIPHSRIRYDDRMDVINHIIDEEEVPEDIRRMAE